MKTQFNGKEERGVRPKLYNGPTLYKMVQKVNDVFGKGPKPKQGPKPQQGYQSKKQHRERFGKEKLADDVGKSNAKNPKKEKMVKKAKPIKIWKKKSIFWEFKYWNDLDVCHCIDVMHVEKNVCDNIWYTAEH
jgi:hypothetical protein